MNANDKSDFDKALCAALSVYEKPEPNETVVDIWMYILAEYSLQQVREAFRIHVSRSKFAPKPADIVEIIHLLDGRPSADEAWPIAVKAADESQTVVWTEEIRDAWFHCLAVFESGDDVGARMAFKKHYQTLVDKARSNQLPIEWSASIGHDPDICRNVINKALTDGLISAKRAPYLLPAPEVSGDGKYIVAMLTSGEKTTEEPSEKHRAYFAKIREILNEPKCNPKSAQEAQRKAKENLRRAELEEQERLLSETNF